MKTLIYKWFWIIELHFLKIILIASSMVIKVDLSGECLIYFSIPVQFTTEQHKNKTKPEPNRIGLAPIVFDLVFQFTMLISKFGYLRTCTKEKPSNGFNYNQI